MSVCLFLNEMITENNCEKQLINRCHKRFAFNDSLQFFDSFKLLENFDAMKLLFVLLIFLVFDLTISQTWGGWWSQRAPKKKVERVSVRGN